MGRFCAFFRAGCFIAFFEILTGQGVSYSYGHTTHRGEIYSWSEPSE